MAMDSSGNTYVASSGATPIVTALRPDGSVLYEAQLKAAAGFIAAGQNGALWVVADSVFQLNGVGNALPVQFPYPVNGSAVYAGASDSAGNLYLDVPIDSMNHSIVELNPSGAVVGGFSLTAYGKGTAMTVDSTGAVYVVGAAAAGFPATSAAYPTTIFGGGSGAYLLKIRPTLDQVVFAALIGQDQTGSISPGPSAVAVDSAGNVYVGGSLLIVPDGIPQLGTPVNSLDLGAYVMKFNAEGSALVWAAGVGPGYLDALAVLPDGRVRAAVDVETPVPTIAPGQMPLAGREEALFTIRADGGALESAHFVAGVLYPGFSQPGGYVAAPPGGGAVPARMLVGVNSGRIPVVFNDQTETPLIVDFVEPAATADLSLSLQLGMPLVNTNQTVDVIATVRNNGPADAEGIQLSVLLEEALLNGGNQPLECFPGGLAICNGGGALIPNLPAGAAMNIELVFHIWCNQDPTCSQSVDGRLFALSPDPNLADNVTTLPVPYVTGFDATLALLRPLIYFRSDTPLYDGGQSTPPTTADPSLTVWIPAQTYMGNTWYFDSWPDGNRDNPRTFDASNGFPSDLDAPTVHTANPLGIDPPSLDLVALPGAAPLPQVVTLYPTIRAGTWTVEQPAASWLTLSVNTDTSDAVITGTANIAGMAPGYYQTTFRAKLTVDGLPDAVMDVPASLRIMATAPTISPGGIVNAASYQAGPIHWLELVNIFGSGLGPPQLVTASVPQAGQLPTTLGGTSVTIGLANAQLLYVQDGVIAAIAIADQGSAATGGLQEPVTVTVGGTDAATVTLPAPSCGSSGACGPSGLGLFTSDSSGTGNLAAVNADGTINSSANPAKRGSTVLLYGTGFLEEIPNGCGGGLFGSLFLGSTPPVEAFIGGKAAYVQYSGTAPGLVCAVQQFNVVIPTDSATGPAVPVQLGMPTGGEFSTDPFVWSNSQPGTTLAIQ